MGVKLPFASGGGVALARAAGAFMPGFGSKDGNSLPPGSSQESLVSPPATPATVGTMGFNSPPPPRSLSGVSVATAPTLKYGATIDLSTPQPEPVLPDRLPDSCFPDTLRPWNSPATSVVGKPDSVESTLHDAPSPTGTIEHVGSLEASVPAKTHTDANEAQVGGSPGTVQAPATAETLTNEKNGGSPGTTVHASAPEQTLTNGGGSQETVAPAPAHTLPNTNGGGSPRTAPNEPSGESGAQPDKAPSQQPGPKKNKYADGTYWKPLFSTLKI